MRETLADWLMLLGALILFLSLFLVWSHQGPATLPGLPRSPTAWQVYSAADVFLALISVALVLVAFAGRRAARATVLVPVALALAFTLHASATPPTNGALVASASAGAGETVAIIALLAAALGLILSFTAD